MSGVLCYVYLYACVCVAVWLTCFCCCVSPCVGKCVYTCSAGLNKDDAREKWGEEQVHIWRRSYDVPPPGGESLKDTAARVLPYYEAEIAPLVKAGKTVLVTAHGNSLRALVMKLEGLDEEAILKREIATGAPIIYGIDAEGNRVSTEEL